MDQRHKTVRLIHVWVLPVFAVALQSVHVAGRGTEHDCDGQQAEEADGGEGDVGSGEEGPGGDGRHRGLVSNCIYYSLFLRGKKGGVYPTAWAGNRTSGRSL